MGYSKNPVTLEKRQSLFIKGATSWRTAPGMADKLAYQIRECFYIAQMYPQKFPDIAKLAASFRVVVTSPTTVGLKPQVGSTEAVVLTAGPMMVTQGIAPESPDVADAGFTEAAQIVKEWLNAQPTNDRIIFRNTALPAAELIKLYHWAAERTPPWAMFLDVDGVLTLAPYQKDMAAYYWNPDDLV